jgi:hypothetical protein
MDSAVLIALFAINESSFSHSLDWLRVNGYRAGNGSRVHGKELLEHQAAIQKVSLSAYTSGSQAIAVGERVGRSWNSPGEPFALNLTL